MSLSLIVTSYRGEPPLQPISLVLERQSTRIGRANDNNLVLPDPEKYVSSHHAAIEFRDNTYYLCDTSSNGVFILPSDIALGRNNMTALRNGDKLSIGEYQLAVTITDDKFLPPASIKPNSYQTSEHTAPEQDPFTDLGANPISILVGNTDDGNIAVDDFDFFESKSASGSAKAVAVEQNHIPMLDEAFDPFQGKKEPEQPFAEAAAGEFLPENWFDGGTDSVEAVAQEPMLAPIQKPTPAAPLPVAPTPTPAPKATVDPPPATTTTVSTSETDQNSIHLFCQGAGIPNDLEQQLSPETFLVIGKMLRISIQGAMEVLMARTKIKNEMRLDITTIRAAENNPIKFSINADEALARLLKNSEQDGYKEPVQALEEAFDDIKAHQIAVIAGMQTALQSVLKRFDPERLETRLQKQNPISASIPIHKQATLWSQFEQLYENIEHEAQDDFNRLFGNAFSSAYEEQIQRLKTQQES